MNDALVAEGGRQLDICNACRYCEGYCAVFPAIERRRRFDAADLLQLSHLCHDCRDCLDACMYAPPHPFGVNPPALFATIRREHADALAGRDRVPPAPRPAVPLVLAGAIALVVVLAVATGHGGALDGAHQAASPYRVLAYPLLLGLALGAAAFGWGRLGLQARRHWRESGPLGRPRLGEVRDGLVGAATLHQLSGNGAGCTYPAAPASSRRRVAHLVLMWGFFACLAATVAAAVLQDGLGHEPPFAWWSAPVLLGTVGGIGLVLGASDLLVQHRRVDPLGSDVASRPADTGLLLALLALGLSGLATLLVRHHAAYGVLLSVHLGLVLGAFACVPYTKFPHALYRSLALVRDAAERRRMPAAGAA